MGGFGRKTQDQKGVGILLVENSIFESLLLSDGYLGVQLVTSIH